MPKRTDIKKICIIGAGPIVIGQACEFDYSGAQACKVLRQEGYEVVLLNSNPATIMTDTIMADRTYIEPVTPEFLAEILRKERPDALLPTLGGQTALNVAFKTAKTGILEELGIEMLGADADVINRAEDRGLFKDTMAAAGIDLPKSAIVHTLEEGRAVMNDVGLPCIIRPAFTLGGTGGGVAWNVTEYEQFVRSGIEASMVSEVLVEEYLAGWKEFELEVMRDKNDNVVIVCTIENLDPMGVHTGDSITVAPIQTLTDREFQKMRDQTIVCMRAIGVESGGCNVQWAVDPKTGRMVIIEMNPRVSRSSALASKATGFPIAKIAAKVAVGYTLDEIMNDITRETPACFEPSIDYCVIKIPRFNFEKFPGCDARLTSAMKSVGEVMAIGRTFKEALQKGVRSMETGRGGFGCDSKDLDPAAMTKEELRGKLATPNSERLHYLQAALRGGMSVEDIHDFTGIDPWFLHHMRELVEEGNELRKMAFASITPNNLRRAKRLGYSDRQLSFIWGVSQNDVRKKRIDNGIEAVYKLVDTCASEFEAYTPYYYSTYERVDETRPTNKEKIMILGGGPNRIGQGIEFDYCCVHASFSAREEGYASIMVNCNPETVSTDYDTSDRLYFEPLTVEDVLSIVRREQPKGVIVQFGGQTPLNIARQLQEAGVTILGTSVDSIDDAGNRSSFKALLNKLGLLQPGNDTAWQMEDALAKAAKLGYPLVTRPSFVLGGAKMEIIHDEPGLRQYWSELGGYCARADLTISEQRPILLDKYLENTIEVDVDVVCDRTDVYVAGIMEHIEEAGIHSGDSACALPPFTLPADIVKQLEQQATALALELQVQGLMNVQFAVKGRDIYILEVNPRASRTVPFVSKVTGVPLAKVATQVMLGHSLMDLGLVGYRPVLNHVGVKEAALPFSRFPGTDCVLGPEMKSTGEVMGIDADLGIAFAKAELGVGMTIPQNGTAFISVKNQDKDVVAEIAGSLRELGFNIVATRGTCRILEERGIEAKRIFKVSEGNPNVIDMMINGTVKLIINTPSGKNPHRDEVRIRTMAVERGVPLVTTMRAAEMLCRAIRACREGKLNVKPLQEYHAEVERDTAAARAAR